MSRTPARGGARGGAPTRGRELRARGKRTLARVLDAGARVFADRGYHAARVDDIVKAAEVSHGTFYLYFSSKQDLFRAIAEDIASDMLALARELPPLDRDDGTFRAWLERFHELYERHGKFLRTWTEAEVVNSELGRTASDLVTEFSRQLATRVRSAAPDLDAGTAAFALVSMIERTTYYVQSRQLVVSAAASLDVLAAVTEAAVHGAREAADPGRSPVRPPAAAGQAVLRS
jgi:AcrR family transcriptional regulator